jgi:hypothetical protein
MVVRGNSPFSAYRVVAIVSPYVMEITQSIMQELYVQPRALENDFS